MLLILLSPFSGCSQPTTPIDFAQSAADAALDLTVRVPSSWTRERSGTRSAALSLPTTTIALFVEVGSQEDPDFQVRGPFDLTPGSPDRSQTVISNIRPGLQRRVALEARDAAGGILVREVLFADFFPGVILSQSVELDGDDDDPSLPIDITSINPPSGPNGGGTQVVIIGNSFLGAVGVTIGGITASVSLVDSSGVSVTIITPSVAGTGPRDVVVTSSIRGSATEVGGFSYVAGIPTFGTAQTLSTAPDSPRGLAIGNLDGVSGPDFVVAAGGASQRVYSFRNNGSGGFTPVGFFPSSGSAITDVKLADVNSDGNLDAITSDDGSTTISCLPGSGAGSFGAPTAFTFAPPFTARRLAVTELNSPGDGLDAVVVGSQGANGPARMAVFFGNGTGSFPDPSPAIDISPDRRAIGIAAADLSGDGLSDLAISSGFNSVIILRIADGSGGFTSPPSVSSGAGTAPNDVVIVDLDGDGLKDVLSANGGGGGSVSFIRNNGALGFSPGVVTNTGIPAVTIAAGDTNGDGNVDVLVGHQANDSLLLLLGDGTGAFPMSTSITPGLTTITGLALVDLNGDARLDIVACGSGSNAARVLLQP